MTFRTKMTLWIGGTSIGAGIASFAVGYGAGTAEEPSEGSVIVYAAACVFVLFAVVSLAILAGHLLAKRLSGLVEQAKLAAHLPGHREISMEGRDEIAQLAALFNHVSGEHMQSEEARTRLVSDAAHELRTPVAILRGHMETMLAGAEELKRENLIPLLDETKRMTRLIQELQQLNMAESGQLALDRSWVYIGAILREVVDIFGAEAEEKRVDLHYDEEEDKEVYCDPARVKQVLINLIGNAIRYTPERGSIHVRLSKEPDGFVRVEVADNGPGIPPDKLPYIFHRFYRVDDSRSRTVGGMGLGLAIAKKFAEAHGGRLNVTSEVGKGTAFVMALPVFPEI